jgi:hypothetical protein
MCVVGIGDTDGMETWAVPERNGEVEWLRRAKRIKECKFGCGSKNGEKNKFAAEKHTLKSGFHGWCPDDR